ncbi:hypothetical protein CYG48_04145 [Neorhizobium sp. SOG26]|nr:hypothetical protein CYG48_04145 [Neorhizobium sp. SOG26]
MLLTMLSAIYSPRHRYIIHIDRKSKDATLSDLPELLRQYPNITFLTRHKVAWGGLSQITIELRTARMAMTDPGWDYFVFLSGTDFPVRPLADLEEVLVSADKRSFIDRREIATLPPRLHTRLRKRNRFAYLELLGKSWRLPIPLKWFGKLPLYYGSQWHFLHRSFVEAALDRVDRHGLPRIMRYCSIPDEVFWQNILNDVPGIEERIVPYNHRYIQFSGKHPKWLVGADIPAIESSGAFFARKFDPQVSFEAVAHFAPLNPDRSLL